MHTIQQSSPLRVSQRGQKPSHLLPRERMYLHGVKALSTEDLIAILLGSGCARSSLEEIAKNVSNQVMDRTVSQDQLELCAGIGRAKSAVILAALELGRRVAHGERTACVTPEAVYELCMDIRHLAVEHLLLLCLSTRMQIESRHTVSIGTVNASLFHPREILRLAIQQNAVGIIMVHNHPSGDPTPSTADVSVTENLSKAAKILDIALHDHVVVAEKGFVSLRVAHPHLFW